MSAPEDKVPPPTEENAPTATDTAPATAKVEEGAVPAPAPAAPAKPQEGPGAIVKQGVPPPPLGLDSDNVHDLWRLAQYLSSSGLLADELKRQPYNVLHLILVGKDRGLRPLQALSGMHIIEGKASLGAHAMVALCLNSPACEYLYADDECCDEIRAVYVTRRRGWPPGKERRFEYTMDDAARALLLDKGKTQWAKDNNNWRRMPKTMLLARAGSGICNEVYPDIVLGMYDPSELEEIQYFSRDPTAAGAAPDDRPPPEPGDPTGPRDGLADRMRRKAAAGRKVVDVDSVEEVHCVHCGTPTPKPPKGKSPVCSGCA